MKIVTLTLRIETDDLDADPDELAGWAENALGEAPPLGPIKSVEVTAVGADPDDS